MLKKCLCDSQDFSCVFNFLGSRIFKCSRRALKGFAMSGVAFRVFNKEAKAENATTSMKLFVKDTKEGYSNYTTLLKCDDLCCDNSKEYILNILSNLKGQATT